MRIYHPIDKNRSDRFKNFMADVRFADAKPMKRLIITKCHITEVSFSLWLNGKRTPKRSNQKIIDRVVKSFGYPAIFNEKGWQ